MASFSKVVDENVTARANSLREQVRPCIEEKSLKKLQRNSKMTDLANLKFKATQKYLNLKNRTNITFNYLLNKVNNRSKFLDSPLSNSFAFSKKSLNPINNSLTYQSAFSPALLFNNNTFKIDSKIIKTISRDNLDQLDSKLNENEYLLKQINDYRSKISKINQMLEEMEALNQEVIFEEDQETVKKDENMKDIELECHSQINEIRLKRDKIEYDLEQCLELYRTLKMELNAVLHKKNYLKAKLNEQKRVHADVSMQLKSLVENNRRDMNEFQRKIIERRERDLAIIKAFRIRKIELSKCLEEKENLVKKNLNLSVGSLKTSNDPDEKDEQEHEENREENELADAAYNEYNVMEEFNPEMDVKIKYFNELRNNYRICRRDTIWQIKLADAAHLISDEQRFEDVEGILFVDGESDLKSDHKIKIGDGYFSTLYQGKSIMHKTNDKKLIIKEFNFGQSNLAAIEKEILMNGFKVCAYLSKHPNKNIVEIMDLYEIRDEKLSKSNYYLVEEYCLSNLKQFICDFKNDLYLNDIRTIADGLANALFYLHCNGIAHQNVCTLSVQINERKIVKLGYLECCAICYSPKEDCFKTKTMLEQQILDKQFAAPEVLKSNNNFDPIKADIYSYGLILAYCYKRKPFDDVSSEKSSLEISEEASSLIENCLQRNPDNRFTIYEILTHCFFY